MSFEDNDSAPPQTLDGDIAILLSSSWVEAHLMANLHIFGNVYDAMANLSRPDKAKIAKSIFLLESNSIEKLVIKTLRNKIKEIIVKRYRLIFFEKNDTIYLVDIFKKQSQKTPTRIIDRAEQIYNLI